MLYYTVCEKKNTKHDVK